MVLISILQEQGGTYMNTFRILEDNLERLTKKINRIRTKCNKYGCDFYYAEVGEEFAEVTNPETGAKETHKYILVECEGTAKVNGWRFIATLEHHDNGNIVRKLIDEVEVPEKYYTCGPACDHCHSIRHRKDTYLIYNEETKEFKQVGSSCVCDFTNGFSAEAAAAYIALFDELIQGEAPYDSGHVAPYYEVSLVLAHAADIVNHLGYRPTSWEGPRSEFNTRYQTLCSIQYDRYRPGLTPQAEEKIKQYREQFNPDYNSPELAKYVADAMEWVRNSEDRSDYMHNLKVIVDSEYIQSKNFGYAVSIIPTYNKYIQKQTEAAKRAAEMTAAHAAEVAGSEFVGEVGQRITIDNLDEISIITSWETEYGITTRYKITDASNHIFMWDSSSHIRDDEMVEVISIVGTVKKHDTWNDVKQTWLTRCRVNYREIPKEERLARRKAADEAENASDAVDAFLNFVNDNE